MTKRFDECPRCDSKRIKKAADSPKKGYWEVYRCEECNYVWRSTENLEGIHKYDKTLVERAQRSV